MYCSPSRTKLNCFCAIPTDSNLCISEQYQQAAIYFWAVPASNNIFLYNTNRQQSIYVLYNTNRHQSISVQYQQTSIYFCTIPTDSNLFLSSTNKQQSVSVQYQQTAIYFWAVPTSSNLFLCNTNRQQSMQLLSQPWQGILKTVKPFRNPDFVQYFAALTVYLITDSPSSM